MQALLSEVENCSPEPIIGDYSQLSELLLTPIVEVDGCLLLWIFNNDTNLSQRGHFVDNTGFEATMNHMHIKDFLLDSSASPACLLQIGRSFARVIADRLRLEFSGAECSIIVSLDLEAGDDCLVRFHRNRPGEHWLDSDLESYREAVGVIIVNPS